MLGTSKVVINLVLFSTVALESLISYSASKFITEDDKVSVIALFDHEEIGSGEQGNNDAVCFIISCVVNIHCVT